MKGNINVSVENIFPLIKKFLYSDHEIFLRELISNATDATLKLKHLVRIGEAKINYQDPIIEVKVDKENKKIHVIDHGIGMTGEEVEKYINQIAFSGAEEFLNKYKDTAKDAGIIGHFGLGFYSAFMVADKVEILTKSYKEGSQAVRWECDGSPQYTLENIDKPNHGTEIILHIAEDSTEFLQEDKIRELLLKYNRFMPVPIKLGTKKELLPRPEGVSDEDYKPEYVEVDNIINNPNPLWTKQPSEITQEQYNAFYHELYPTQFDDPIFSIHLNVDYPFTLTGILYFPKLSPEMSLQKDRIQLYQNQVFITDNVEGIVPDFLTMLRGVIDSPDIPLNVSRSYLQADGNVKKISGYITRKVADKLQALFKENREDFQSKWNDIKIVIEYGMLSDEKFFEKAQKNFALYPTTDGEYFTFNELLEKIKPVQTDKDGKTVILYASNKEEQHAYIQDAKEKGYTVLLLDSPIVAHLIQKIESAQSDVAFVRVDADSVENLVKKEEQNASKLSEQETEILKKYVEEVVPEQNYTVQVQAMDSQATPVRITQPEFMRRMKEMQAVGGGMMHFGNFPQMFNLVVNANSPLASEILNQTDENKRKELVKQALDLAKLSQGLLKGEDLTQFVKRSFNLLS